MVQTICPTCNGQGKKYIEEENKQCQQPCSSCKGEGTVDCVACNGTGKSVSDNKAKCLFCKDGKYCCQKCGGKKTITETITINTVVDCDICRRLGWV